MEKTTFVENYVKKYGYAHHSHVNFRFTHSFLFITVLHLLDQTKSKIDYNSKRELMMGCGGNLVYHPKICGLKTLPLLIDIMETHNHLQKFIELYMFVAPPSIKCTCNPIGERVISK